MTEKFNLERLLRSVGFSADIRSFDDKGDGVVKKDDYGTSRFYDHPIGVRVELVYDDNKLRKPENLLYYQFVDFRSNESKLTDDVKETLVDINNRLNSMYSELFLDDKIVKYIVGQPKLTVSVYRTHCVDRNSYYNDVDYWMAIFENLNWEVGKVK